MLPGVSTRVGAGEMQLVSMSYGFRNGVSGPRSIHTCILGVALYEGTVRLDLIVDELMLVRVLANSQVSRHHSHRI